MAMVLAERSAPTICHMSARTSLDVDAIARRIAARRETLGLEQDEVADRAGMSRAYISRLENGGVKAPKVTDLAAVAGALDVTVPSLLYGEAPLGQADADALVRALAPYLGTERASEVAEAIAAAPDLTETARAQIATTVIALARLHAEQHAPLRRSADR